MESPSFTIKPIENTERNRDEVSRIFVAAYYEQLSQVSKDKETLTAILRNSFLLGHFYGAYESSELAGIFALSDENERCFRLDRKDFTKALGAVKGRIIYRTMKKEFEHPLAMGKKGKYIEAVATDISRQGKGIATRMMEFAMEHYPYLELDVTDTNLRAYNLYKRLGFVEYKTVPARFFKKLAGYNKKIFMYHERNLKNPEREA